MDVRYPSSFIPCPLCNQRVYLAYTNKLNSYRKILPKIVLPTVEEEPVDPQPAALVTHDELEDIQKRVQEAIMFARKRHAAGTQPVHVVANFQPPL